MKNYWISNNRGEGDAYTAIGKVELRKVIKSHCMQIMNEYGHVSGGYRNHLTNGDTIISNGEFRMNGYNVQYFADYTERQS